MSRYITFTEDAKQIIEESFTRAKKMYGGDYDDVMVMAGNYAGFGRGVASYSTNVKLIQIPINPTFEMVELTRAGFSIMNEKNFIGTMIHECAHHFVDTVGFPDHPGLVAGDSIHTNSDWCYICAIGWNCDPKTLARGIRLKVPGLKRSMASYDPYGRPNKIIDSIPLVDEEDQICEECGGTYIPKRTGGKFCTDKCRMKSYRKNKKG